MKRHILALGLSLVMGTATAYLTAQGLPRPHRQASSVLRFWSFIRDKFWPHPVAADWSGRPTPEEQAQMDAAFAPGFKLEKEAGDLFKAGRLPEAEQKCHEAVAATGAIVPVFAPLRLLGDIQLARGKFKEALENYGANRPQSMRHIPGYPEVCMRIAQCYVGLGDIKEARKFYAYATARSQRPQDLPGAGSLRSLQASLLLLRGLEVDAWPEEALRYYQAAGKLAPRNWWIIQQTADTLYWLKRYDEAMPYYRLVLKHQGKEAPYDLRMRVEMYDRRNRPG